jgi:FkbM family methyltransferase
MTEIEQVQGRTKYGRHVVFQARQGTNDGDVVRGLAGGDGEYEMPQGLTGWAMDIGAHIGAVCVPLALDNPGLMVIAVEAVPENVEILRANVQGNGLTERIIVIQGAAGRLGMPVLCHWGYRHDEGRDSDGYVAAHRFVGNTWMDQGEPEFGGLMDPVDLEGLLDSHGIALLEWLKIDCEGCEWDFLDSPALFRVKRIVGEYHSGLNGSPLFHVDPVADIRRILEPTHVVDIASPNVIGPFVAVLRGPATERVDAGVFV